MTGKIIHSGNGLSSRGSKSRVNGKLALLFFVA